MTAKESKTIQLEYDYSSPYNYVLTNKTGDKFNFNPHQHEEFADFLSGAEETHKLTSIKAMIQETEKQNPYKEIGNRDSYSKYNEGWADACDIILNQIEK